jgi:hypothetical protein
MHYISLEKYFEVDWFQMSLHPNCLMEVFFNQKCTLKVCSVFITFVLGLLNP